MQAWIEQVRDAISRGEKAEHKRHAHVIHSEVRHELLSLFTAQRVVEGGERVAVKDVVL